MPLYDYECIRCGNVQEEIMRSNEEENILCIKCGRETKRLISTPTYKDFVPYVDENLGPEPVRITCPGQKKRLLRERGLIEAGLGETRRKEMVQRQRHIKREKERCQCS